MTPCDGPAFLREPVGELRSRPDAELAVDATEVRFDRLRTQQWVRARLAIGRAVGYSTPSTLGTRMMPATAKFDPPALRPIRKSVHAASLTRANWQAAPRRSSCICGRSISGVSLAAS